MTIKSSIKYPFLAFLSRILVFSLLILPTSIIAAELPLTAAADQVIPSVRVVPPGFYQFNNLEILKGPTVDELPAEITVLQKNDACVIYEGGKEDNPLPCPDKDKKEPTIYTVQIEERTTLLGADREPAVLSDFVAGDHINVLGWLSSDFKIIRAAVVRNLATDKNYHQSLSGTVKSVLSDGFVLVLDNGTEIRVKTPIVEGAQVTIKGVFDKFNNFVSDVLSVVVKPFIVLKEVPAAVEEKPIAPPPVPSKTPSTLFKNFLRVFGL